MNLLGVALAGSGSAIGAVARYSLGRAIGTVNNSAFPWGTWLANIVGTALLGIFAREFAVIHRDPNWWLFLGTGFCGGFTTFSTMSHEAVALLRSRFFLGIIYLATSFGLGLVLAWMTTLWA